MSERLLPGARLSGLPEQGLAVVGFSGGADSTALAHWLAGKIAPERIVLAHVNHMLRGEEAERDEAAARQFARETGLRFVVSRVDVKALAKQRGMGLEECGRAVRYEFFESLAPGKDDRIFTAHNADDNAETVLLHLCRGAGLSGLCGIPPQRGKVLRPLLGVSRGAIEAYCAEHGLSYVTDSTNASPEYARNRLRLEVLPLLKELNPKAAEAISQAAELLRKDEDFLRQEAEALLKAAEQPYGLNAQRLQSAPEALRTEAVKLWLERLIPKDLERKHLEAVERCLLEGGALSLPQSITVRCAQGQLSAVKGGETAPFALTVEKPEEKCEVPLPGGKVLVLEKIGGPFAKSEQKIHNLYFKNALDYDIITKHLTVRTRREGDRFSPAGRNGSKPLKQVFQESGMPPGLREGAVLLECSGRLAWCESAGAAEGFAVTEKTAAALAVAVRPGETAREE